MAYLIFFAICIGLLGAPIELLLSMGRRFGYRQVLRDLTTDPLTYLPPPKRQR